MMLTDPPYNVAYTGGTKDALTIENDRFKSEDAFADFLGNALGNAQRHLKDGGSFYVFYASSQSQALLQALSQAGLRHRQVIVWVKNAFVLGHMDYQNMYEPCLYGWKDGAAHWFAPTRRESTVVDERPDVRHMEKDELVRLCEILMEPSERTDVLRFDKPLANDLHPTMKPIKLMARLVENSSRSGETVLDPFGGSGSTLLACEKLGRKCWTMELDPHYCDVILQRWENLTGKEAKRVD